MSSHAINPVSVAGSGRRVASAANADLADLYNVGSDRQLFIDNAFFSNPTTLAFSSTSRTKTNQQLVRRNTPGSRKR